MSIGFMLPNPDDAVIWRGPRKNGLIKQFLKDVNWGPLDYLIIDSPPGTSDEHISVVQFLQQANVDGALIVTTPQEVSIVDVRKEINFCKKTGIKVLGVVENMSGLRQPLSEFSFKDEAGNDLTQLVQEAVQKALVQHNQQSATGVNNKSGRIIAETDVFWTTRGGAAAMSSDMGVPFLGKVPLDSSLSRAGEEGRSVFNNVDHDVNGTSTAEETTSAKKGGLGNICCGPALWGIIEKLVVACEGEEATKTLKHLQ